MARISLKGALERAPDIDRAKLDATTEADIRRYMIEDGFDPDAEPAEGWRTVLPSADVRTRSGIQPSGTNAPASEQTSSG